MNQLVQIRETHFLEPIMNKVVVTIQSTLEGDPL